MSPIAGAAAVRRQLGRLVSGLLLLLPPLCAAAALFALLFYLDVERTLEEKFGGRRWDFASKVYSAAWTLGPGLVLVPGELDRRLGRRGYVETRAKPARPGQYRRLDRGQAGHAIEIFLHAFQYPDHREAGRLLRIDLDAAGRIQSILALADGSILPHALVEPVLITGLHGDLRQHRREMKIEEIPVPLVSAVVAVEDRRFFEHRGLDVRGIARAMAVNLRAGGIRQGGSTLTQQLMKNFFLTEQRTFARKLKEAVMAVVADRRFSKLEIIENYMTEIYMGQRGSVGVYGMWEAASYYFGKEPRDLSLGEIATLVAMIRAPNYYNPRKRPDAVLDRRNTVLAVLRQGGDIDERTYLDARAEALGVVPAVVSADSAWYFVDAVRAELSGDFPARVLTADGYTIFTGLDLELQAIAERAVAGGIGRIEAAYPGLVRGADQGPLEAALVVLDPRSGEVLALVGGRDYSRSQFNRVTNGRRQPGSLFKPVVVLAALGGQTRSKVHYRPNSKILDEEFEWEYEGQSWSPANYAGRYYGEVTVRTALERSLNTAMARLARDVGIEAVRDLAVRLGINEDLPPYPSIALGGWEVSPLEIAGVYSVFASGGIRRTPHTVQAVVDRRGRSSKSATVGDGARVVAVEDAYLTTHLLAGVMDRGSGSRARALGVSQPAAGKTGTTNNFNDAWFAGYTPELLAVVWVGFDKDNRLGLSGATAALPIWAAFMKEALAVKDPLPFEVPAGISLALVDADSGMLAGPACRDVVREAFLVGEAPSLACDAHGREH
ncbi:MAG: PBP1A family penicillin-binding protein [Deltaproteobacteria bacterium]